MKLTASPRTAVCLSAISAATFLSFSSPAAADFALQSINPIISNQGQWVNRGDGDWMMFQTRRLYFYSDTFAFESAVTIQGSTDIRGSDYDPINNRIVVNDYGASKIIFARPDGTTIDSFFFPTSSLLNDLAVNPINGDIWVATFGGDISRINNSGAVLQSFSTNINLTGFAIDPISNTFLIMRADGSSGPLDDNVYEYSMTGQNLGLRIPGSQIDGNGLGLDYIYETGTLAASAQNPYQVYLFRDPSRIPEPACTILLLAATAALPGRRR